MSHPLTRDWVSWIEHGLDIAERHFPVTRDRLTGYREAAAQAGIDWGDVPSRRLRAQ